MKAQVGDQGACKVFGWLLGNIMEVLEVLGWWTRVAGLSWGRWGIVGRIGGLWWSRAGSGEEVVAGLARVGLNSNCLKRGGGRRQEKTPGVAV
nr:hypothetical protein [Tanacetum cinerariifolium]